MSEEILSPSPWEERQKHPPYYPYPMKRPEMTREEALEAFGRFALLSAQQKAELDDVAEALHRYFRLHKPRAGGFSVPTRVTAMMAIEAALAFEKHCWED